MLEVPKGHSLFLSLPYSPASENLTLVEELSLRPHFGDAHRSRKEAVSEIWGRGSL
jgi:hypothetical protein